MAKNNSYFIILGAVSGILLTAFFFEKVPSRKFTYQKTKDSILLSYIPPLEYIGVHEYLTNASLQQPYISENQAYSDVFLEIESLDPIIDSVIRIPQQFRPKRKV